MVVDMQKQKNFIITLVLALIMLFTWNTAYAVDSNMGQMPNLPQFNIRGTMQIDIIVNGEKHPFPIVSMRKCPHKVKIIMQDSEGGTTEEELEASCE